MVVSSKPFVQYRRMSNRAIFHPRPKLGPEPIRKQRNWRGWISEGTGD